MCFELYLICNYLLMLELYMVFLQNICRLDILSQSALLNVQEKFDNVLSLWKHVSVNCDPQMQNKPAAQNVLPGNSKKKYTLVDYLDLEDKVSNRPGWINLIRCAKSPKTFRELLDEIRDILEHEDEYIPSSVRIYLFKILVY